MKIHISKLSDIIYGLFLLSGMFKSLMTYFDIRPGIDLTLIFSIYLLADILNVLSGNSLKIKISQNSKNITNYVILITAFLIISYISLLYTPSRYFAFYKSAVITLNLLAFIYPIFKPNFDLALVFKVFYYTVIPFSIFIIILNSIRWTPYNSYINIERADLVRGHYLGAGLYLGIIALHYITERPKSLFTFFTKIIFPIALLFLSSARGPLIFFIIILILRISFISKPKFNVKVLLISSLIVFVGMFTPIKVLLINILERTIIRFSYFFESGGGRSLQGRFEYYDFSVNMLISHPEKLFTGFGIGSFNLLYEGIDGRGYPHNILLESLFELGIIGCLILALILFTIYIVGKNKLAKLLPLFVLLCFSKSGGLEDTRILFAIYAFYFVGPNINEVSLNVKGCLSERE